MQNIQQAIKQAQALQKQMAELQKKLEQETVEGTAGGNMVRVTCTCKGEVKKVEIDKSIIDPNEKEMLEDLIVTAFNNAKKNSDEKAGEEMKKISSAAGIPMDLLNSAF
jgi:DNA-binding YbaB/EbfC family protein